jgi:cytidylate kinase
LNGEDVSDAIRTPEASMGASNVSAIPAVRTFLFDLQRDIAKNNNCIMDGRDIGTVVLPDAQIKIFLTASPEARAQRRYKELIEKGEKVEFQDVLDDINKRDYQDSHREIAPLKQAEDAILVDNSGCNLEEGTKLVLDIITERLK